MNRVILILAAIVALDAPKQVRAGISYTTTGDIYSQDFNAPDGFPASSNPFNIDPETGNPVPVQYNASAHIQNGNTPWPGGWRDDYVTDATYLGVPGWYLWSDVATLNTSNGGFNSHAQFRYGGGGSAGGTGFFAFSTTACGSCGEKALGIRSASAFTNSDAGRRSYLGMQLTNDTGETLTSFTITYDGEQYSEGAGENQDGFDLQWSLAATVDGWKSSDVNEVGGFYDGVSGVDYGGFADSFLSPINENPGTAFPTHNMEGNKIADISHTVSGIEWAPGADLWIRWRDKDAHDGIAIDNVRFSATGGGDAFNGDVDGDGLVDGADFLLWQRGLSPGGLTGDDLQVWQDNVSASVAAAAAIPEPSTWALGALAAIGLGIRRRLLLA